VPAPQAFAPIHNARNDRERAASSGKGAFGPVLQPIKNSARTEVVVCVQGKAPKATKPKVATKPLDPTTSHNSQPNRSIEEIYQKKSQLEHILLRPDTYIGSTERQQQVLWVHDGSRVVQKQVEYVPGLYKIFDEILVNAADNKVRDPTMDILKVDIEPVCTVEVLAAVGAICLSFMWLLQASNTVRVWNNGAGVPVDIHKEEGVYVPELIFGHLLTSSNYDDNEKKVRLFTTFLLQP
jgi:DNA topoisomerase II